MTAHGNNSLFGANFAAAEKGQRIIKPEHEQQTSTVTQEHLMSVANSEEITIPPAIYDD